MISSTMVGTGHLLPRILSNQPGGVPLHYDYVHSKTGGLCKVGERQERQLEGVGTESHSGCSVPGPSGEDAKKLQSSF